MNLKTEAFHVVERLLNYKPEHQLEAGARMVEVVLAQVLAEGRRQGLEKSSEVTKAALVKLTETLPARIEDLKASSWGP